MAFLQFTCAGLKVETYYCCSQVPHLYCIGDANGKMMLAHAASAQGISGKLLHMNHCPADTLILIHSSLSNKKSLSLQEEENIVIRNNSLCFPVIVVEQVTGRDHILNHLSIPAACFTHPEISMVGLTEVKV